jgi:hypothetical protein
MSWFEFNEDKAIWYFFILGGAFIPIFVRLIVTADFPVEHLDIKDVLFAGLAMTISNFNLIGSEKVKYKSIIFGFSAACILFTGLIIAEFLFDDIKQLHSNFYYLTRISYACVFASIVLSYITNRFVFKKGN